MIHLSDSEFEMFLFFETTPDLVCIANKEGFFKKVNKSVIQKLGYTEEELSSQPIASFIHPEDRDFTASKRVELLQGRAIVDLQNRYVTKKGDSIWLHWTSIYLPDKEVVFAIAKDVTAGKISEKEIKEKYKKFKGLATHFKSSIEKDKRYLAVELHEDIAQLASVVKMDLDWVMNNATNLNEQLKARLNHALSASELLINSVRSISYSISPNMLTDVGLWETLKWQCDEFAIKSGIPCQFENSCGNKKLSHEIQLDLFRICQEALSNIMNHAQATAVQIKVASKGNKILLSITDNGIGFKLKYQKETSGLINMRERAASVNGQLIIKSKIGIGTKVTFAISN
jgi:PAS domain S-box-containing protein